MTFTPRITAFLCQWCGSKGADMAGTSRMKYPSTVTPIRVPCTGRIDLTHVLEALRKSDGVLIGGCYTPSNCHYKHGNYQALKRVELLKVFLKQMGVNPNRIRLEWIRASEGKKFAGTIRSFTEQLEKLGPLTIQQEATPE
ncbi:hydrogenase iron-sulfur subunit [Candidatus Thorarchaeota archaeon]|nr:MAG: hydrogenase iron-sulfur subunit [Candidatus Thorarchaeota archaeon]